MPIGITDGKPSPSRRIGLLIAGPQHLDDGCEWIHAERMK